MDTLLLMCITPSLMLHGHFYIHVFVVYYFAMQFGFESSAHMTQDTDTMRSHVRELKSGNETQAYSNK